MTSAEITALKQELEDALLTAFTDFQRVTGVGLVSVDLTHMYQRYLSYPKIERILTNVTVQLESL